VTVILKQRRTNRVTVVGAVKTPGVVELPRGSSYLMDALVKAGGLAEDAGKNVEIQQPAESTRMAQVMGPSGVQQVSATQVDGGATRVCLNLTETVTQPYGGTYLRDGAVVRVEQLELEPVQVLGLVARPRQIPYPANRELRLFGALAESGGLSSKVADKIIVIRKPADGQAPVTIKISMRDAKEDATQNILLAPGDVVSVEQTPATILWDAVNIVRFSLGSSVPLF
jgi:polysaccharide export outer membrane protein